MRHFSYLWSQLGRYIATVKTFIAQSDAALPLTDEQKRRHEQQPETELDMPVGYEEFVEATEVFPQALRRYTFVFILTLLRVPLTNCANISSNGARTPCRCTIYRGVESSERPNTSASSPGSLRLSCYIGQTSKILGTSATCWFTVTAACIVRSCSSLRHALRDRTLSSNSCRRPINRVQRTQITSSWLS